MIGAIVLTLREREGVKRQKIARQLQRTRAESVELVKVKPGEGA
jgi:NADH-quinone oxidoreductase subunit J